MALSEEFLLEANSGKFEPLLNDLLRTPMSVSEIAATSEHHLGFGINSLLQYICRLAATCLQAACSPVSADRQAGYRQQLKTLNNRVRPFFGSPKGGSILNRH